MVETLWLEKWPQTTEKQKMRIEEAMKMAQWREILGQTSIYSQHAICLLAGPWRSWKGSTLVENGGGVTERFETTCKVSYARNLDWVEDISADPKTVAAQLVGELLDHCMEDCLIYEDTGAKVVDYVKRDELRCGGLVLSAEATKRECVYHSHTRAFVSVSVDGYEGKHLRGTSLHYGDGRLQSMLQPNGTELYEGTVQNYDVGENGKDKWWEIIAQWARKRIGRDCKLILMRSRYLMLTKIGEINGHLCRFEIFEERNRAVHPGPRSALQHRYCVRACRQTRD